MEPVVKLTWAPRKDGLRLSAELWLTFSKSELLLFIFNRCLERGQAMDTIQLVSLERPNDGHRPPMLSNAGQHWTL